MSRVVAGVALVVATLVSTGAPAGAETSQSLQGRASWKVQADDQRDTVEARGHAPGREGRARQRRVSGGWRLLEIRVNYVCRIDPITGEAAPTYVWLGPDGEYVDSCHFSAAPPPIPSALAEETAQEMALPRAAIGMSPPQGGDQLVNLPTWLWVENWSQQSTTASLRGVAVTVTATPAEVAWDMGAGDPPITCGAGRPYDPSVPASEQSTDCSYTYRRSSFGQPDERFVATASMRWAITWTSSTGAGGTFPLISTTTTFTVRVTEGQAVVTEAN